MLLSGLSAEALDARYPQGTQLPAMTPRSITSPARLRSHLAEVRERGVAYDDCESNAAVNCAAAPVYDSGGAMVAAMSISVPTFRWNDEVRREWSELVRAGAAKLSQRLGHTPLPHGGPA
jgi:DNA-binding IclR family transcriptional regulator